MGVVFAAACGRFTGAAHPRTPVRRSRHAPIRRHGPGGQIVAGAGLKHERSVMTMQAKRLLTVGSANPFMFAYTDSLHLKPMNLRRLFCGAFSVAQRQQHIEASWRIFGLSKLRKCMGTSCNFCVLFSTPNIDRSLRSRSARSHGEYQMSLSPR